MCRGCGWDSTTESLGLLFADEPRPSQNHSTAGWRAIFRHNRSYLAAMLLLYLPSYQAFAAHSGQRLSSDITCASSIFLRQERCLTSFKASSCHICVVIYLINVLTLPVMCFYLNWGNQCSDQRWQNIEVGLCNLLNTPSVPMPSTSICLFGQLQIWQVLNNSSPNCWFSDSV